MQRTEQVPRRVLVLGGTGFLGSEIAKAFLATGASVTTLARHEPSRLVRRDLETADVVQGDVRDAALVPALLRRSDHVVFAVGSALPEESNADPAADARSLPSIVSFLEHLRERPRTGITYLSSGGTVYGNPEGLPVAETAPCNPVTSYGVVKVATEKYLGMYSMLYGIRTRILRVGNAYGPRQPSGRSQGLIGTLLAAARDGTPVGVFGEGTEVRDYIHVADVAKAVVGLSGRRDGPRVVNVGSGSGHSVTGVVDTVRRVTRTRIDVRRRPARGFDARAVVLDVGVLSRLIPWDPLTLDTGIERSWKELPTRDDSIADVA